MEDETEEADKRPKSLREWLGRFIDAAVEDALAAEQQGGRGC